MSLVAVIFQMSALHKTIDNKKYIAIVMSTSRSEWSSVVITRQQMLASTQIVSGQDISNSTLDKNIPELHI